jgi:hypothetical protein
MRLVIVESPYAGDVERNIRYARACIADCLRRGEAPFASHLLYTQEGVLDDGQPEERELGIEAGLAWGARADATVVYEDRGITPGMSRGVLQACLEKRPVEYRSLGGEWSEAVENRAQMVDRIERAERAAQADCHRVYGPTPQTAVDVSIAPIAPGCEAAALGGKLLKDLCGDAQYSRGSASPKGCDMASHAPQRVSASGSDPVPASAETRKRGTTDGDLKPRGHKAPLHLIPWEVVPPVHVPDAMLGHDVRPVYVADDPADLFHLAETLLYDVGIETAAYALAHGAKKYGPGNWKTAVWDQAARDEYRAAIYRHLVADHNDEANDPESGVLHKGHAIAGCLIYLWHEKRVYEKA